MIVLNSAEIKSMDKRYRVNFINSLSGFKSLFLIGTKSDNGTNLAIFNSVKHIGADPPLLGFISRPDSVDRHTLQNIRNEKYYTLNAVSSDFYEKAHHTAARYPNDVSEFKASELDEEYLADIDIPFVKDSPLKLLMKMEEEIRIKSNNTVLVIGSVQKVFLENKAIEEDGFIDLEALRVICGSALDAYYTTEKLNRLDYAKPNSAYLP